MSKDKRARRVQQALGIPYSTAFRLLRDHPVLVIRRDMSDDQVREAFQTAGLPVPEVDR